MAIHGLFFQSDENGVVILAYNSRTLVNGAITPKARTVTLKSMPASMDSLSKAVRESLPCACRIEGNSLVSADEAPKASKATK